MKKSLIAFAIIASIFTASLSVSIPSADARSSRTSASDVYVRGYTTKTGRVVAPYYRTRADSSKTNNYSCLDHKRCK